jgi:hypothetical protein
MIITKIKYTVHNIANSGKDKTFETKDYYVINKIDKYLRDFYGGLRPGYYRDLRMTVHTVEKTPEYASPYLNGVFAGYD